MRVPMFPLGNVVLPGELLPLNVFEPRYRQLVLDCLAADVPEFGVVLIERGSEVGGGDVRTSIGTVARIVRVVPLGNGRFEIAAAGIRRVSVLEWLADNPYPRSDVEDWPESEPVDGAALRPALERLVERIEETRRLADELAKAERATGGGACHAAAEAERRGRTCGVPARRPCADRARRPLPAARRADDRDTGRTARRGARRHRSHAAIPAGVIETSAVATTELDRKPPKRQDTSIEGLVNLVRDYAKQETIGPLRGAGRWLGYGVLGALLLGIGLTLLLLGLLRVLQAEWTRAASGSLSWLAYLVVLVVCVLLLALTISRINKPSLNKEVE